ncbi:branched-chain amino acid ABC transporter permease [Streptomyces cellulosae]|jgi:branched-chain amino acid transport system permease protein|uniref:Branched-chain amino acid transport system permease protein n=1 Tax=Streptomyces thermodiastaticus TaxID=44061 RepID=A0ABU0KAU8_9ACTN|nr:branched-chain amino acid ABC transporter permease [Streptomyces sp. McG8]MCX4481492.1 branched-chain amino acid ABC transporter permease [Streptomyces cellulosae]MDQ0485409.1 branched-chain amino acid transport system permease protein [Streptomyces thermodiastaticus]MDX3416220.1 branched-chain amino acid ABC transporter permease [Streptomyces sp. MD20-1-1]MXQ57019.1 branched-chain amino acid ABC transporter permease [Streptomyces sp. XHT-2]MYQ33694.1 branched-chain amino acid ABC transport
MDTLVLLTLTGLGLGALYFLIASGLALIFGLMDVLNFAHGAFLTVSVYAAWRTAETVGGMPGLLLAAVVGTLTGLLLAAVVELVLIRRLYGRVKEQILVTVGLSLAVPALVQTVWGADARPFPVPDALSGTVGVLGARVPVNRFLLIAVALLVLAGIHLFLSRTRYGLIVRAGVEDRAMVTALGIDVTRAFTLVFALGGALAGLAGVLGGLYFGSLSPHQGTSLLVFAFVVVIIGGLVPITSVALSALTVGLVQQYANYYAGGYGDLAVVVLLAAVVLSRPAAGTGSPLTRLRRALTTPRTRSAGGTA